MIICFSDYLQKSSWKLHAYSERVSGMTANTAVGSACYHAYTSAAFDFGFIKPMRIIIAYQPSFVVRIKGVCVCVVEHT